MKSVEIFPRLISVGMNSEPPGIPVSFEEMTAPGPFEATMIAGGSANVSAPATATVEGSPYVFGEWSDGGARSHQITRLESINLLARYGANKAAAGPRPLNLPQRARLGYRKAPIRSSSLLGE